MLPLLECKLLYSSKPQWPLGNENYQSCGASFPSGYLTFRSATAFSPPHELERRHWIRFVLFRVWRCAGLWRGFGPIGILVLVQNQATNSIHTLAQTRGQSRSRRTVLSILDLARSAVGRLARSFCRLGGTHGTTIGGGQVCAKSSPSSRPAPPEQKAARLIPLRHRR